MSTLVLDAGKSEESALLTDGDLSNKWRESAVAVEKDSLTITILVPCLICTVILVAAVSACVLLRPAFFAAGSTSTSRTSTMITMTGSSINATTTGGMRQKCEGAVSIAGHGMVSVINAGQPMAGTVEVLSQDRIAPFKSSRAYIGDSCTPGEYRSAEYAAIVLPGKMLTYTIDMNGTDCSCVVGFHFVSMRQNTEPGNCSGDFFCDATAACGVACTQVGIMEANRFIWKTSLHNSSDYLGRLSILQGGMYGPKSKCINTDAPFRVSASVSLDASSVLVTLAQERCSLETAVAYPDLDRALRAGLTPVLSYAVDSKVFDNETCREPVLQEHPAFVEFSNFSMTSTSFPE